MALLSLALAVAAPAVAQDHTGLMPADTPVVLRIESVDAAHAAATKLHALELLPELPAKGDLLVQMLPMFDLDLTQVDPSRPIYLGTQITMGPAMPTVVLPALDATALSASVQGEQAAVVVRGDWVGVSLQPGYAAADTNAMVAAMEPGVASVHVDLESLLEMFGGFLEMGLAQMEATMMEEMPSPDELGGMDMAVIMEVYLDGFRTFIDCAESLDLALHMNGEDVGMHMVYTALEDSELADLLPPRDLPATLPATIDSDAQLRFLMAGDWQGMMDAFGPWMEALMEMYPAEMAAGMTNYMNELMKSYALIDDAMVGHGGFGPEGMQFSLFGSSSEPAKYVEAVNAAIEGSMAAMESFGLTFGAAESVELGGAQAVVRPMAIDYGKLIESYGVSDEENQLGTEQMQALMKAMYGENPSFAVSSLGQRVALGMGPRDGTAAQLAAGLATEAMPAAAMFGGLDGLPAQANPVVVYHVELTSLLEGIRPALESMDEQMPELPEGPVDMAAWMALSGRRWMGGMTLNADDLKRLAEAMK